jgi:excisionase family DNA binding protein
MSATFDIPAELTAKSGRPVSQQSAALPAAPTPSAVGKATAQRLSYTLREAAALLQISEATYYRGVREGRLPGRKVGGQWRVPCGALHRYAEGAEPETGGDAA